MPDITEPPASEPVNRHRTAKRVAKAGSIAAGVAVQSAQLGTGTGALALLAGSTSATGVGLVVTGGVLTVASALLSGRSAYKTKKHLNGLNKLLGAKDTYKCCAAEGDARNIFEHKMVSEQVLPYIIRQKKWKLGRKSFTTIPGTSLLEGIRAVSRKGYKYARGTLGVERDRAARWLAFHLITHDCDLVEAIVSELYGEDEMTWLKHQDASVVVPLLAEKLKST